MEKMRKETREYARTDEDVLSCALFPQVAPDFLKKKYHPAPEEKVREITVMWKQ